MSIFDDAFKYLEVDEGGFSNDPNDHGGATRWGITRAEAARWLKRPVSVDEMKSFPLETAKEIYQAWYWLPLACDKIESAGVATALFDIGVVRGIGVPPIYAQEICGVTVDGHIGPKTLEAINVMKPSVFITDFSAKVEIGFRQIVEKNPSQERFLTGWVNRAHRLLSLTAL